MVSGGESRRNTRKKPRRPAGLFAHFLKNSAPKSTLDKSDKPPIIDISIIDMSIGGIKMQQTFHILLYRAFHAQSSVLRPCLTKLGLGTGQPKILGYLSRNGASGQRQLADYYDVDPAAVCRMLDSLEKGGFVTRHPDEADKRRSDRADACRAGGVYTVEGELPENGREDAQRLYARGAGPFCRIPRPGLSESQGGKENRR